MSGAAVVSVPLRRLTPSECLALAIVRLCEQGDLAFESNGAVTVYPPDYFVGLGSDPNVYAFADAEDAWNHLGDHAVSAATGRSDGVGGLAERVRENVILPFARVGASRRNRACLTLHQAVCAVTRTMAFDTVTDADAVAAWLCVPLRAMILAEVARARVFANDCDMLHAAHVDALDARGASVMTLTRRSEALREYLRCCDPGKLIKFAVFPVHSNAWRIVAVSYPDHLCEPYVPLPVQCVWPTQEEAENAAREAVDAYYSLSNIPRRAWRWLTA